MNLKKLTATILEKNKTHGQTEGRPANTVLPKAGLNSFGWTFVQGSTAVILLSFCAKNPRLRQYPKRSAKEEQEKMKNKNER